jgi:hypothetical protein
VNEYNAGRFGGTYKGSNGRRLWAWLNDPLNVRDMQTATYLGRPAVEPLSPGLVAKFGDEVAEKRTKQMLGHMVRQIVEPLGYVIDQQDVPITREGNIFRYATRYKKRD